MYNLKVTVSIANTGNSEPNDSSSFEYILDVSSVSDVSISPAGGALLTVSGAGFVTADGRHAQPSLTLSGVEVYVLGLSALIGAQFNLEPTKEIQEIVLPWFQASTAPPSDDNRTLTGAFTLTLTGQTGLTTAGQTSVNISANASAADFSAALGALAFSGGVPDVNRVPEEEGEGGGRIAWRVSFADFGPQALLRVHTEFLPNAPPAPIHVTRVVNGSTAAPGFFQLALGSNTTAYLPSYASAEDVRAALLPFASQHGISDISVLTADNIPGEMLNRGY
ncbi:hypothetical protein T484DRAFT_1781813 [Baffinella frigidus]|nr:hypothetical protein T484DRAFT_1781813 [Cryptophyta sp. CCMP2293]